MAEKSDSALLKQLMREDGWDLLMRHLGAYIDEINAEKVTGATEFEALRMLHTNQGRAEGAKNFFEKVEKHAFE